MPLSYPAALEWLFNRTRAGDARSSERSRELLVQLGRPDLAFPAVHVLGTNGKGSVCAMLAAGLEAASLEVAQLETAELETDQLEAVGAKVGRFVSPHLLEFRERISVNGVEIPQESVLEFLKWAIEHAQHAAFFDLSFVMAMQHFQRQGVGMAVVEAGVGGTGDASSALERVKLTVLTNVDLDHEAVIGVGPEDSVLKNIALEKAGAIRAGVPVVTAAKGDALEVVRRVASERNAPLYELNADDLETTDPLFHLPHPPRLRGPHQLENARLAVAALRLLGHGESVVEAALNVRWAGRLEVFRREPQQVLLDGAHNPAGACALAQSLQELGFERESLSLVFGAMGRKNVVGLLEPLLPFARHVHFVSPGALGADPEELRARFGGTAHRSLQFALNAALEESQGVLVAGSLYLVGAARAALLKLGFTAQ